MPSLSPLSSLGIPFILRKLSNASDIWRSDLTEGFLRYRIGGPIFGGAYFRNFTVCVHVQVNKTKFERKFS